MVNDKKIEETARYYCNSRYPASQDVPFIAEGFRQGAKWMQEEFLKDLWHPASEEPREKAMLLIEVSLPKPTLKKFYYTDVLIKEDWEIKCSTMCISRWLYVDDLLPKKGDNIK